MNRILMICGMSGSGKTELLCKLISYFNKRGVQVATIKHAHDGFNVDQKGKDSWRHREAGACEVLVASDNRWVLMHENTKSAIDPSIYMQELVKRISVVDLILIEGFKNSKAPKIEVRQPNYTGVALWKSDPYILAVAAASKPDLKKRNMPITQSSITQLPMFLPIDDIATIADFIMLHARTLKDIETWSN